MQKASLGLLQGRNRRLEEGSGTLILQASWVNVVSLVSGSWSFRNRTQLYIQEMAAVNQVLGKQLRLWVLAQHLQELAEHLSTMSCGSWGHCLKVAVGGAPALGSGFLSPV